MNRPIQAANPGLVHVGDTSRWTWTDDAVCRPEDLALFFGYSGETPEHAARREADAKELCSWCPVREQCLQGAMQRREKAGIFGGLTAEERGEARRRWVRAQKPKPKKATKPKPRRRFTAEESEPVDGTGAWRRVRALARRNFGAHAISKLSGVGQGTIHRLRSDCPTTVTRRVAEGIKFAYSHLSETENTGPNQRTRATAFELGWAPPEAWVGVDIDDPDARPRELAEVA